MTRVEHLAEMTLIDENTQLILTDDPIRKSQAIWQCMWRHLVAKVLTNASGATWWLNFQQMHVAELAMFYYII